MEEDVWKPCWIRGRKIEEIVWIGKAVLAWCSGLYIVFFNIVQKQEILHWCCSHLTGDGAHCISGHVFLPIFAFSEKSLNPRIFVFEYPSMTKISQCVQGCQSGYLSIAFTAHDHLVSLGSYPDFPMIVWCWRTGVKIVKVDTSMQDEIGQIIRINPTKRIIIGQMGKTCGKLFTWELDIAGNLVIMKDHEVKLPMEAAIQAIDWCPTSNDPLLAITDRDGHIYLSNYDGSDIRCIAVSQRCNICIDIKIPAICWFRGGIILRTTFCQIRYFKKKPKSNDWRNQWYIRSIHKPYILVTQPFRDDWLFYYTLEGYLMQIIVSGDEGIPSISMHLHRGGTYHFVDFLRPWCHHLVTTDDFKTLVILESYSGSEISRIELDMEGIISGQVSHLNYPLVVIISDQGEMIILGVTNPEQPNIVAYFRLQREALDLIKFSYSGQFLIAAQKKTGNCYCVNVQCDKPWSVMAQLQVRRHIIDIVLYDDTRGSLKVLVLCVEYEQFLVGHQFLVYNVSQTDRLVDEAIEIMTLPGLFRDLCHVPGSPEMLVGSPYLQRHLNTMKLHEFKDVTLTNIAITGHHVRLARVFVDRRWITTCAFDGLVVVRDKTILQIVAAVPTHHRLDSGSLKAIVNSEGDMIVALGHDGSLVALQCCQASKKNSEDLSSIVKNKNVYPVNHECYEKQKEKIFSDYASLDPQIHAVLNRIKQKFPTDDSEKSWIEWQQNIQLHDEAKACAEQKAAIMKNLVALKATIKQLLDSNETCPEIERLSMSAFDLDQANRDQRLKAAKDERDDVRTELEYLCVSMDNIADWMKTTFWDSQTIQGRSIFSFHGDTEVTSYSMIEEDPYFKEHLLWAQFMKDSVRNIIVDDTFQPWRKYTDDQLQVELSKPMRVYRENDRRMDVFFVEEEREIDLEELERLRVFDGMTTNRFVEQSPYYYSQMESYGFAHVMLNDYYLMHDCDKLRDYFNKLFDDMYVIKEREISAIREKNEKIRYIDTELKLMFGQSVSHIPIDPQWQSKEKVETIIQVLDHEVKAKPYISPSQQDILDKRAAEAERIRQLLLADDFRERTLMKMMDGVLEIRWKDTIKIDVRKPSCMFEKEPEQYISEDILAVKKYEEDVEILQQERERYKRMLEADYVKINGLLQEGIDQFDTKLNNFFQLKLKIESAIYQLKLRHLRGRMRNIARCESLQEDGKFKEEISKKRLYGLILEEHLKKLHDVHQDLLVHYDVFCNSEKTMKKRFTQEFAALSKVNIELLERQYKRRPKISLKNVIAIDLINLGEHLIDGAKSSYLPKECLDYMKILVGLDMRPDGLPQSISIGDWDHLIRLRRHKVMMELKIKAQQLKIATLEQMIAIFEDKINMCKSNVDLLIDKLKKARDDRITREQDVEIQLVLTMGQVEIELRGERRNTMNAIFVPRKEIEKVNEHILTVGSRKLNALKRTLDFRHGISSFEWEHRCLKKHFKDLQEDLNFLKDITVTKDMRTYLKRKAKGLRDDKTAVRLEREIEASDRSVEKALSKETDKLHKIKKKIVSVKEKNAEFDRTITEMNVTRWEMEHQRDLTSEKKQHEHMERKMRLFKQRSEMIRKLQDNYTELLALQTEYELLRLRTYPTLEYFKTPESDEC